MSYPNGASTYSRQGGRRSYRHLTWFRGDWDCEVGFATGILCPAAGLGSEEAHGACGVSQYLSCLTD